MDDALTPPKSNGKKAVLWIMLVIIVVAIAVAVLFFLNPASLGKQTVKAADEVAYFSVVSVSPGQSSEENDPNSSIIMTFTQAVDPETLRGYFTVSPMVPGTFSQGETPEQVIFTPKFSFGSGSAVKVILNHGFQSVSGAKFNSDYTFNFYTKLLDNKVQFNNDGIVSGFTNIVPGKQIDFHLQVGSLVDPTGTITLYKGTVDQFLNSLTYTNEANPGSAYVTQTFIRNSVDTSGFQEISTSTGLSNDSSYTFNQGPGLYYIEAKNKDEVAGSVWVNVTDEGLITRQDDQKIYIATQNVLSGETNADVKVSLYNLENSPTLIGSSEINGAGSLPIAYPKVADFLVGETGDEVILVPLSIPETQSDIRVASNLSDLGKIFLYTDRPTYEASDTIQFSGIVRLDNDGQYSLPPLGSSVRVWIPANSAAGNNILDEEIAVNGDGSFSGHFLVPQALVTGGLPSISATLYAQLTTDNTKASSLRSYTTFDVVNQADNALIKVNFDRAEYSKNDKISAHINGIDNSGQPLSNQSVTYSEYLKNYYDADPGSRADFGSDWGYQSGEEKTVTLDENGHADIALDPISGNSSQALTVEAGATVNGSKTYGAKTVLVRQGKLVISFGGSRESYHSGDTTITRVHVHDLGGNSPIGLPLKYQIYTSQYDNDSSSFKETTLVSGNVTTDSNGFALIQQPVTTEGYSATIRVSALDGSGNTVNAERTFNFIPANTPAETLYYHDPTLTNLDVATDRESYSVGDTANLVINSPFDQNVWITYERGRVYHSEWIHLNQGDNNYQIPITEELSPSFNVMFSYFHQNRLNIEGLPITVSDVSKHLSVSLSADKISYGPNDKAAMTILTKDNQGNPVGANISVTVLDDNIFNLRDALPFGDINWYYFMPRAATTNFSASTLGIGTGEGCGGGSGEDIQYVPNRLGTTVYWNPNLATDENGKATASVPLPSTKGSYRVLIRAWTDSSAFGQSSSIITVQ